MTENVEYIVKTYWEQTEMSRPLPRTVYLSTPLIKLILYSKRDSLHFGRNYSYVFIELFILLGCFNKLKSPF